jgi:hypothetical protein
MTATPRGTSRAASGMSAGDRDVAGGGVLHDVAVGDVGAALHPDGGDGRVPGRHRQPLVGDEHRGDPQPIGGPQTDVLHVARRGVGVHPERHRHRISVAA